MNKTEVSRVLFVRFSAIGDCVMASWAATAIRKAHPDAFLVWAVESRCSPVVDRSALTSRVHEVPRHRWKRSKLSPATWYDQARNYLRLRQHRFDVGFDLQGHSKTSLCLRLAGPKKRIMAQATDAFAARLNPVMRNRPDGVHTVDWNQATVQTYIECDVPTGPMLPQLDAVWETVVKGQNMDRPLVTISTGAGALAKMVPPETWLEVARHMVNEGFAVWFLGGPSDPEVHVDGTLSQVGRLTLIETMSAVCHSRIHLAADTGTGHMAAACGVPVVSVFGPTDPRIFRPYTDQGVVLKEGNSPSDVQARSIVQAATTLLAGRRV